jgi:Spy/CpxP family protein refolding chaperone
MDIFSENKLLIRLIIALVLLNTGLVGYVFWQNNANHPEALERKPIDKADFQYVSNVLKRELNLTEIQVKQFQALREDFFKMERVLTMKIRGERDSMNVVMFNKQTDPSLIDTLARRIAAHEYEMEMFRFAQAQQLRKICTPEQMEKFETLVLEIRDYFKPDKPTRK